MANLRQWAVRFALLLPTAPLILFRALPAFSLTLEEVIDRLQASYQKVEDFSARFHQVSTLKSLGQTQEAGGLVYMKRPGKMRWEYKVPEARLVVSDGQTLWIYTPESKQVIIQDVSTAFSSEVPLGFLAGKGNIRAEFDVKFSTRTGTNKQGFYLLDLYPKRPNATLGKVSLEVNPKTFLVDKATVYDVYANTTAIAIKGMRLNVGLADSKFTFEVPPGAEVLKSPLIPGK